MLLKKWFLFKKINKSLSSELGHSVKIVSNSSIAGYALRFRQDNPSASLVRRAKAIVSLHMPRASWDDAGARIVDKY